MRKIAIIPARSGSKGLTDKNIKELCGKPMLAYSIGAAKESKLFDRIIVSTDSPKYASIAKSFGAEVMMRDERLASDSATTFMVIEDILTKLKCSMDYFVLLQPTSPLRTANNILEACSSFESQFERFDFLVSVCEAEHASILVNPIAEDGSLRCFDTDFANYRRQSYKDYRPNGALFIGKPDAYLAHKHFFGERSLAYIMDKYTSIDIDDELDFYLTEYVMKNRLIKG